MKTNFLRSRAAFILRWIRAKFFGHGFSGEVIRWFADKGDETLRQDYPNLDERSIVFDVGGYLGDFAESISRKYSCFVYVFEPHPNYYEKCVTRFYENEKITVLPFGLSDLNGFFELSDTGDGSSFLNPKHRQRNTVRCEIREFFSVLNDLSVSRINLMKLNIEGGEYPLLQHIADNSKLDIVDDYQIQFHNFIDNADQKRAAVLDELSASHHRTWCYEFVWENWSKIT